MQQQNYRAYVLHTSLKLNLPHRLCLWTFLLLSNVLPIPESPKNIVNMNYFTFDEPIGLLANDFIFVSIFVIFQQLSLVARGKTHTTKSVRACQLIIIVLIISLCTLKYLCGLCGGGFEQTKIFIKGAIIYFRTGGSWEKPGVTDPFFLKIGVTKNDKEIVWWLQHSKCCSMQ